MALDPNIYQNIDPNFGLKLGSIFDPAARQQREESNRLANLASIGQEANLMQNLQQMKNAPVLAQRAEQEKLALQKKKYSQELDMFVANSIASGMPKEQVFQSAAQKAQQYGFNEDETRAGLEPLMTLQDPQQIHQHYLTSAMPEEAGKAKIKQMFPEPKAALSQEQQRGQIIFDAQGNAYNVNPYTNEVRPVAAGGKQIQGAQYAPNLQGQLAGAKEAGKSAVELQAEAKKAIKKSDQLLAISKQAKTLLEKGPTGSGIGSLVDAGGRIIGNTTESATLASELETVSGWMVANVPRMEGPQSNFDVQNYQTMAAKIGDRTVPVKERLRALDTLTKLQEKYKHLNQGIVGDAGGQNEEWSDL